MPVSIRITTPLSFPYKYILPRFRVLLLVRTILAWLFQLSMISVCGECIPSAENERTRISYRGSYSSLQSAYKNGFVERSSYARSFWSSRAHRHALSIAHQGVMKRPPRRQYCASHLRLRTAPLASSPAPRLSYRSSPSCSLSSLVSSRLP